MIDGSNIPRIFRFCAEPANTCRLTRRPEAPPQLPYEGFLLLPPLTKGRAGWGSSPVRINPYTNIRYLPDATTAPVLVPSLNRSSLCMNDCPNFDRLSLRGPLQCRARTKQYLPRSSKTMTWLLWIGILCLLIVSVWWAYRLHQRRRNRLIRERFERLSRERGHTKGK